MPWTDPALFALVIMAAEDLDFTTALQVAKMSAVLEAHKATQDQMHGEMRDMRAELNAKIDKHEADEKPRLQRLERLSYLALGGIAVIGAVLSFLQRANLF